MYIDDFIWLPSILDKVEIKHQVSQDEVEEVFFNRPRYRFVESGHRDGEDVYAASGQTEAGRYLIVFFIHKSPNTALILSARDMDKKSADVMSENKKRRTTSISQAQTLEETGEFWDTHSLEDYWDETHEVEFEVRAKRRKRITVEPHIYKQLETEARLRGVVPETLVNLWLAEKLQSSK